MIMIHQIEEVLRAENISSRNLTFVGYTNMMRE